MESWLDTRKVQFPRPPGAGGGTVTGGAATGSCTPKKALPPSLVPPPCSLPVIGNAPNYLNDDATVGAATGTCTPRKALSVPLISSVPVIGMR